MAKTLRGKPTNNKPAVRIALFSHKGGVKERCDADMECSCLSIQTIQDQ